MNTQSPISLELIRKPCEPDHSLCAQDPGSGRAAEPSPQKWLECSAAPISLTELTLLGERPEA